MYCLSHLLRGGGTTSLRIHLASGSGNFLPLIDLPLLFMFFGVICLLSFFFFHSSFIFLLCFIFFSCFVFLFLFPSFCFLFSLSFNVSGLLVCVCCACRIQYDGMALHCVLPLLHYDALSLCRIFVIRACISLVGWRTARTRGVLDITG